MICPNCGTSLHENSTMSMYCNTPIERKITSENVPAFDYNYSRPLNMPQEIPQTEAQNKSMVVVLSVLAAALILIILCIFMVVSNITENSSGEKFREEPDAAMEFEDPYMEPQADDTDDGDSNIVFEEFDEPAEE